MFRRELLVVLAVAVVIALIAWAVLTSGKSNAPEAEPGGSSSPGESAPSLPDQRIYFAAGGSIYAVRPDGSGLTTVIAGSRSGVRAQPDLDRAWASSPAVSPDGQTLAFIRDYDVWAAGIDGTGQHLLVEAGDWAPVPACPNCIAWSPDGAHIVAAATRIGGSGIERATVANADGSDARALSGLPLTPFWRASWLDNYTIPVSSEPNHTLLAYDLRDGVASTRPSPFQNWQAGFSPIAWGAMVASPYIGEGPIEVADGDSIHKVAEGVAAVPDRSGQWLAYMRGDELRLVSLDGKFDRLVLDLAPLGGRDRHFAGTPGCFPDWVAACSYRPPVLSWGGQGPPS